MEIADTQPESLLAINAGVDNFNGGKIVFTSTTSYGALLVNNVIFNGVEIDMRIDDGTLGASDQIRCVLGNTCTLQANTKLVVTAANAVKQGKTWTLIKPGIGNQITNNLVGANITLPPNVTQNNGKMPNSWQCNS